MVSKNKISHLHSNQLNERHSMSHAHQSDCEKLRDACHALAERPNAHRASQEPSSSRSRRIGVSRASVSLSVVVSSCVCVVSRRRPHMAAWVPWGPLSSLSSLSPLFLCDCWWGPIKAYPVIISDIIRSPVLLVRCCGARPRAAMGPSLLLFSSKSHVEKSTSVVFGEKFLLALASGKGRKRHLCSEG